MTRRKALYIIVAAVLAVIMAGGAFAYKYALTCYHGDSVWVYIPDGADDAVMADSLQSALGAPMGRTVVTLCRVMKVSPSSAHGAYRITDGDCAWQIARRFRHRTQTPVRVTFNNIRTMQELAVRIDRQLELSADDFMAAADSLVGGPEFTSCNMSAAFVPDTYEFYWTASPAAVVKRLMDYRNRFWTETRREKARKLGLTPVQVAVMASIVEEETNSAAERPIVARLYLNRLHRGMLLQADPTVKWAVGDFSLRRITRKHLEVESAYNTYKHAGLPPGPIRIPAAASMDAVLDAPEHDYIYMCASDDFSGRHKFTASYAEHQRNAERYRAALNRRNIR